MTYAAELASIETRFLDNYTGTPVAMDDSGPVIDPDTRLIVDQPDDAAWVRLSVRGAREEQASLGGVATKQFRNFGLIMIQIFVPTRDGHAAGRALADTIGAIFRTQQFGGITCRASSVSEQGKIAGGWIQTNVDVAYFRDDFL
jgi:hypothetical protein